MKRLVSSITLAISFLSFVSGEKEKSFQVFLLAGQSNMQGQGVVDMDHPKYYNGGKGTLVRVMKESESPEVYKHLKDKNDTALNVRGDKSKYLTNEKKPDGEFSSDNIMNYNEFIKSAGGFGNKSY